MHPNITLRRALVCGAALVASVAMAASADTLATLGDTVGWGRIMCWSLPVSIDLLALVSGVTWLAPGLPQAARRLGQGFTLVTVAGSMVLNATAHLVSARDIVAGPPLIIAVSAVPPLAAALAVHLAARVAQGIGGTAPDLHVVASDTVEQTPVSVPTQTDTASPRPSKPTDAPRQAPGTDDTAHEHPDTVDEEETGTVVPPVSLPNAGDVSLPNAGDRMSDVELDTVVYVLIGETDPPRSYRAMEDRFRELGYVASASRLRSAWNRMAVAP